jgi:hypothetical protein
MCSRHQNVVLRIARVIACISDNISDIIIKSDKAIEIATFDQFMATAPLTTGPGASGECGWHCDAYCQAACGGVHCQGYCEGQAVVNIYEIVSYPSDKFASEITSILKTTDVGVIHDELKNVIFSDDMLNMGLQHLVNAAHNAMVEGIEAKI